MVRDVARILAPKFQTARARTRAASGNTGRAILFVAAGAAFWTLLYVVVRRLLGYFATVPELGDLLAAKLLALVLLSFFGLLVVSNVISALSTFFLARDLDMLLTTPVGWASMYAAKLFETMLNSSWMVIALMVPLVAAYGVVFAGGLLYPFVAAAVMIPLLVIPASIGAMIALFLVNVFSARRTREFLGLLAMVAVAGSAILFRMLRPERLATPDGYHSVADFLKVLRAPASQWLPSEWASSALLGWLRYDGHAQPYVCLWGTAAALVACGALLHRAYFHRGFSKSQESNSFGTPRPQPRAAGLLAFVSTTRRELIMKELRVFFRDSTQWSQLILLVVLVGVYVFNVRMLPRQGEGISFFLANVIPFLNLGLAGFVLASIAARFLFPTVSLEGRTWWLLKASPLQMRDMVLAKFWVGAVPLVLIAIGMVLATDLLLHVSRFMTLLSVATIAALTIAISSLAVAIGTFFPQFETENAAQVPTSFGGLVFMMASIALVGATIVLEARPVYAYVTAAAFGTALDSSDLVLGLGGAAIVCVLTAWLPLRLAVRRLSALER